jgi:hypothetical protein
MVSNRWARQQDKAHEMGRARVGKREGLRQTALGAADGLALNRPFAPWPWRWTLTMVASTIASSMSGSSEQASKSQTKMSALTQSRRERSSVDSCQCEAGVVFAIHPTSAKLGPPLVSDAADPRRQGSSFCYSINSYIHMYSLIFHYPTEGIPRPVPPLERPLALPHRTCSKAFKEARLMVDRSIPHFNNDLGVLSRLA